MSLVKDGMTETFNEEDNDLLKILKPLTLDIKEKVYKLFNSTMELTFPLVVSMIRPGDTPVNYTSRHVDFYSYEDTLPHMTAVLYLTKGAGGDLVVENRGKVEPTEGGLVIFTSGEENTHWLEKVTKEVRIAVTFFLTCDDELNFELS